MIELIAVGSASELGIRILTLLAETRGMMMKRLGISILVIFVVLSIGLAGERKPIHPSSRDKCPVCGMFVGKYSDFLAEILFKDGSYAVFDGAKDLFKYYFNLKKFNPAKNLSDIDSIYVTNYYDLTLMNGYSAYYVLGSDVLGPMGKELISLEKESDAKEFMKDHRGQKILKFSEVTREVMKYLD